MTITDLDLCDHLQLLYDKPDDPTWEYLNKVDGAYVAARIVDDGVLEILWRGSVTPLDWFLDAISETPIYVDELGFVPSGFYAGVHEAMPSLTEYISQKSAAHAFKRIVVSGHSLGAARAMQCAGLLRVIMPAVPVSWVTFCPPRPGMSKLVTILGAGRWYRNREDPVTFVPIDAGLLKHPGTMTHLDVKPPADDEWGPLAPHHLALCRTGVAALNPIPTI